ncbi:MAG: beta-Ala-His dipeptidase [Thermodesulfobacteriota bacterium]
MQQVVDHFKELSGIPRCSGREDRVREFLRDWGASRGFAGRTDAAGNLLVTVPASPGQEQAPVIVLQGHMDMVCEKNRDSGHDFTRDPLKLRFDGEWLRAAETTLGADNGAGLALAMALAEDRQLTHPALELLFTVDEESGLTGASCLEPGFFSGRVLINLDSEDEGVFTIGCAGGRENTVVFPLQFEPCPEPSLLFELKISGLQGGHSGVNIHERRGNANVLLTRLLAQFHAVAAIRLAAIAGGSAHNAIAREAAARFTADPADEQWLADQVSRLRERLAQEYPNEPKLTVTLQSVPENPERVFARHSTGRLLDLLLAAPDGVMAMSREVAGLVETSVNFATIREKGEELHLLFSQRSDKQYGIDRLSGQIAALARLAGARLLSGNGYPGWQPDLNSDLLARSRRIYRELFAAEPLIEIIHAGLECGIIGARNPGLDMISIGPTIQNPHSPDEKLHLPSLAKIYRFTAALLGSYCVV